MMSVVLGDITTESTDAIVNAAHSALTGGGGVDGAIHRAAGPGLLQECMSLPKQANGTRCMVGQVIVTSGHNLNAKHVFHTVAPKFVGSKVGGVYKSIHKDVDVELADCYRESIMAAGVLRLKSISFPSLGTGGHAIPIELACPIAVGTVTEALNDWPTVRTVRFICFSESDFKEYDNCLMSVAAWEAGQ